ncbi:hypothetical protein [Vibrio sp. 10N.237.312.B06]|uniref:hypothetical protein n=1 Tax=Vibrio sp. 10N.237.312.B06 TaxID=3229974 RepID=UPI0035504F75
MKIKYSSLIYSVIFFSCFANGNKLEEQDLSYLVKGADQTICKDYFYYAEKHGTSRLNGLVLSSEKDYDRVLFEDIIFTKYFNLAMYLNNKKAIRMIDLQEKDTTITFYEKPYNKKKLKRGGKKFVLTFERDIPDEYTLEIFESSGLSLKDGEFFKRKVPLALSGKEKIFNLTYKVNEDFENNRSRYVSSACEENLKQEN